MGRLPGEEGTVHPWARQDLRPCAHAAHVAPRCRSNLLRDGRRGLSTAEAAHHRRIDRVYQEAVRPGRPRHAHTERARQDRRGGWIGMIGTPRFLDGRTFQFRIWLVRLLERASASALGACEQRRLQRSRQLVRGERAGAAPHAAAPLLARGRRGVVAKARHQRRVKRARCLTLTGVPISTMQMRASGSTIRSGRSIWTSPTRSSVRRSGHIWRPMRRRTRRSPRDGPSWMASESAFARARSAARTLGVHGLAGSALVTSLHAHATGVASPATHCCSGPAVSSPRMATFTKATA